MEKVNPVVLRKIYDLMSKYRKPSFEELKIRFCPNVLKYKNKILVRLFYMFKNDVYSFSSNELLPIDDFRKIDWKRKILVGKTKKKDIYLTLNEMVIGVFEDPFLIYSFVETHKDLVIEENGILSKFIEEELDDTSEEESKEETDDETDDDW